MIGRTPPHSLEAEEYLLSCCFLDGSDIVARCLEGKLSAPAFYAPANRVIFEKLVDLYNRGVPIDLQILAEELKTSRQLDEIGGYAYLLGRSAKKPVPTMANIIGDVKGLPQGLFVTEQPDKGTGKVFRMGHRPDRLAIARHDHRLAA